MGKVKTTEVELPSGTKAKIRRIGFAAHAKLEAMLPKRPPKVVEFALDSRGQLRDDTTVDELRRMAGGKDVLPDVLDYLSRRRDAELDARVFRVCACTVEPAITPDTVDDHLDGEDFLALEQHIDALHKDGGKDVLPFSRITSAS